MKKKRLDCSINVDRHLGKKLRNLRIQRNLTQSVLGKAVGVTAQQLQKYEKADNRMSASKLFAIAEYLQIPVSYFFDKIKEDVITSKFSDINDNFFHTPPKEEVFNDSGNSVFNYQHEKHENLESMRLIHFYHNIKEDRIKSSIYCIIKSLAKDDALHSNDPLNIKDDTSNKK